MGEPDGYKAMIDKLAFAAINEQKIKRRWRAFFIILTFIYFTPMFIVAMQTATNDWMLTDEKSTSHIAKVELSGMIMSGTSGSAENVIKGLKKAFESKGAVAVVLEINSPGGSPVQSSYIYDEIVRLKDVHDDKPLYVVVEDIAARGGYFVASAGDQILVNKSSVVGSIGVRLDSFGVVGLMSKLGVERRLMTAGKHKGLMDPFQPVNTIQSDNIHALLNDSHRHFIESVKAGRRDRLSDNPDLYTGLMWSGTRAKELGLIDGFGSTLTVADMYETDNIKNFTAKGNPLDRLVAQLGATLGVSLQSLLGPNAYIM